MYQALEELLARKDQRFVCIDTGWPDPGPDRYVASIEHVAEPGLGDAALARLADQLGDVPEVIEFYRRWGGLRLYCDTVIIESVGHASAFLIAHPDLWPELKARFSVWLQDLNDDEREDLLPEWLSDYVVFGEVPNSGNSFLLSLSGATHGHVFEFEHDGFEFIKRGASFATFTESLGTVNDNLLTEIRSHTRYSDGKTDEQWMCVEYLGSDDDA